MRICDLNPEQVVIGLRLRALNNRNKKGTVVSINHQDDDYAWIKWDGEEKIASGFYGNDCECEVVENEEQEI